MSRLPSPRSTIGVAIVGLAAVLPGGTAEAALIEEGTYRLHNHPDGNAALPLYGLRLDELFDVTEGHDIFTFDFDAPDAAMFLDYDGSSIHLYGTAFGGLDIGGEYDPEIQSAVEIDFTYAKSGLATGDDDLLVTTDDFTNSGTITWMETDEVFNLLDYSGDNGYTFRFGDEDDDQGHRGFDGLSGWGWMTQPGLGYVGASDWLFTGELLPTPGALALLGLAGVAGTRRRRV